MSTLLICRAHADDGEILEEIPLERWRRVAASVEGLVLTDQIIGVNPFSGAPVTFVRPGCGAWTSASGTHEVLYECGAVVMKDCAVADRSVLADIAERLEASVVEYRAPIFRARMITLSEVLRLAIEKLPNTVEIFIRGHDYSAETPCLVVEVSSAHDAPADVAAARGYEETLPATVFEEVAGSAQQLQDRPSDELLVRALIHYLEHDAFLEHDTP